MKFVLKIVGLSVLIFVVSVSIIFFTKIGREVAFCENLDEYPSQKRQNIDGDLELLIDNESGSDLGWDFLGSSWIPLEGGRYGAMRNSGGSVSLRYQEEDYSLWVPGDYMSIYFVRVDRTNNVLKINYSISLFVSESFIVEFDYDQRNVKRYTLSCVG